MRIAKSLIMSSNLTNKKKPRGIAVPGRLQNSLELRRNHNGAKVVIFPELSTKNKKNCDFLEKSVAKICYIRKKALSLRIEINKGQIELVATVTIQHKNNDNSNFKPYQRRQKRKT